MKNVIACLVTVFAFLAVTSMAPSCARADDAGVVKEVIKLLKADVGEPVVLSYIEREGAPEKLGADAIVELKKAGASEDVIMAMMGRQTAGGQPPAGQDGFPFDLDDQFRVLKPVSHGPMTIFPIEKKTPVSIAGNYLSLDEAMGQKIVTIRERGDGSVPIVIIINSGKLPIYISAGEIIIGGKQDRIVAYDVIVHPGKELPIEVRCVEHGRWQGQSMAFSAAPVMGGRAAKSAAQFSGQDAVWREVARQNDRLEVESSTGSYQASINKPEMEKAYKAYADALLKQVEGRSIVGMVVAINGKVHAIEMFGSPSLFARLKEKLLKGYVLDALSAASDAGGVPSKESIVNFYRETMNAEKKALKEYEDNKNVSRESSKAKASESVDAEGQVMHRSFLAQ